MILHIFLLFMLINIVSSLKPLTTISYNRVKKVFCDIYNIKNPCNYSIEHVIPQSKFKENKLLKTDMHNLLFYPNKLNLHRSNFKYISDPTIFESSKIFDEKGEDVLDFIEKEKISIKTSNKKIFYPPDKYKGQIARACMYFLTTYPEYKDMIFKDVIDPYTILTWHKLFNVNNFEILKNEIIYDYQKNNNIYVLKPDELYSNMEILLNINLDLFINLPHIH